jgi:hypothetical protein
MDHRRRYSRVITHGTYASIEIEFLPQGYVQGAKTPSNRSGQGAFKGNAIAGDISQSLFGEGVLLSVRLLSLFSGQQFAPYNTFVSFIGMPDRLIQDGPSSGPYVGACTVALYV